MRSTTTAPTTSSALRTPPGTWPAPPWSWTSARPSSTSSPTPWPAAPARRAPSRSSSASIPPPTWPSRWAATPWRPRPWSTWRRRSPPACARRSTATPSGSAGLSRGSRSVLLLPVRPELPDLLQGRREVAPEAHGPVVHEDMGGGLAVRHLGDPAVEAMLGEPGAGVVAPAGGEDDNPETPFVEVPQEVAGPGPRWVPVLLVLPAGVGVEHTVEVDADDRTGIVHGCHFLTPSWHMGCTAL